MGDIGSDLLLVEWFQLVADRHTLIELPHARRAQHVLEIQLAHQDDLQQLVFVRLEIRQNPDLLEDMERQVLCLVDDQHALALGRIGRAKS